MQHNFSLSKKEKEKIFHTELVKFGVKYDRAAKAAYILASGKSDELLTEQEKRFVIEVCEEWSKNHKRYKELQQIAGS
ncbi:hypothetical protein H6G97_31450 [Nostoc flagelliforme FACHB-838]|uniref:Uncharacterized protein n=1 Tax=Nostoc flagelliforme FACHB-838 TaxID=2692904 RepID=A0ABR8DX51_9NOSO|nr:MULTISPECIES: hypothetical protein [Nostoc]MBD2533824.1 hypothetical protein [Nostoc flagelliforme FACHB-838]